MPPKKSTSAKGKPTTTKRNPSTLPATAKLAPSDTDTPSAPTKANEPHTADTHPPEEKAIIAELQAQREKLSFEEWQEHQAFKQACELMPFYIKMTDQVKAMPALHLKHLLTLTAEELGHRAHLQDAPAQEALKSGLCTIGASIAETATAKTDSRLAKALEHLRIYAKTKILHLDQGDKVNEYLEGLFFLIYEKHMPKVGKGSEFYRFYKWFTELSHISAGLEPVPPSTVVKEAQKILCDTYGTEWQDAPEILKIFFSARKAKDYPTPASRRRVITEIIRSKARTLYNQELK